MTTPTSCARSASTSELGESREELTSFASARTPVKRHVATNAELSRAVTLPFLPNMARVRGAAKECEKRHVANFR
jgi:hypothetical protein